MTSEKKITTDLHSALSGHKPLSIDLYVEVLADHEDELKASLDKDADDALLCMLADDGDVAMMVIDWDGSIYPLAISGHDGRAVSDFAAEHHPAPEGALRGRGNHPGGNL